MLIITAKVPRRKLALGAALAALICCCVLALNLRPALPAAASAAPARTGIRTNEDRIAFLEAYGWEVRETPLVTQELRIPEELDDSYDEYLALQESQGFDLRKLAGKRVKRYTYTVTNYPNGETDVQANLLIRRNTVVGAEILAPRADGFIHGLSMP